MSKFEIEPRIIDKIVLWQENKLFETYYVLGQL
jgi:hypothetical protein